MPIIEFICPNNHVGEVFYRKMSDAEGVTSVQCERCRISGSFSIAKRALITPPMPAHLLGNSDGYYKPSATKRFSTKTVSEKDGNKNSAS